MTYSGLRRCVRRVGPALALAGLLTVWGTAGAAADTNLGSTGGLSYWSDTTTPVSAPFYNEAVAACPAAKPRPTGGGIYPSGPTDEARVEELDGWGNPTGWWGRFRNLGGSSKTATVYAICTRRAVKEIRRGAEIGPSRSRAVRAKCPRDMHVTGGGGVLTNFSGGLGHWMVSSHPFDGGDTNGVPDDGWTVRFYNYSSDNSGTVFADATCISSKRLKYRQTSDAVAYCPAASHLTGGGIRHARSDASSAWINTSAPLDTTGDTDSIPDDRWYGRIDAHPHTTYAICLEE